MTEGKARTDLTAALPFLMPLAFAPMLALAAWKGGAALWLVPVYGILISSWLDRIFGENEANEDPETPVAQLFWRRLIVLIWLPIQVAILIGTLWVATRMDHLVLHQKIGLMASVGMVTGAVGIVFAHELIHQANRWEQRLGEWLLMTVLYAHFKSEHVIVHHRYVGTPRDPVTARYNESFYHFFARVLPGCLISAWRAEAERLAIRKLPHWHWSNPFWRYAIGQTLVLAAASAIGGWAGIGFFVLQAFVAVAVLEQVNYTEHYGLTRLKLPNGKYEPVRAHHSWNAAHRVTNYLLINLQRHSDHHARPDRRYPLLQTYGEETAPQLPYGYPVMTGLALVPSLWRRVMNRRVRAWRARHYPAIKVWGEDGWAVT
jgi:alkane 1-monooxygenase